ncbi:uncharacterized protein BDW70DRAFT_158413 [Aspergillus foveolatus]|uniref:uncharacterized protein n=1 Tax=Aspergillus foveolatus TaxID=210207 RepID=UPI003CCD0581
MSSQGDLHDVSENEEQVRPISISKRQEHAQPGGRVSVISRRQPSMAPANGDDGGSLRPLYIGRRGRNIRHQCASPIASTRVPSVHHEVPGDAPTPHAESSAPYMANEAHGGTEPFAKPSVSNIRTTSEGVPNNNDQSFAAQKSSIPRRQPSGPQVNEASTKPGANIQQLSWVLLHSAAKADDKFPEEGTRTTRQPHFQGSMLDALGKPDQEKMVPHRSFKAGSSREFRTPVNEEADLPSKRRVPSLCQLRPTINRETYDALHCRRTASIKPRAWSRPSPGDTIGPRIDSAASSCHLLRPVCIHGEAILQHENKRACNQNESGEQQGSSKSTSSPRLSSRVPNDDYIEQQTKAKCALCARKESEEQRSLRSSVASSRISSKIPVISIEEVKAVYARPPAGYQNQASEPEGDGEATLMALSILLSHSSKVPAASSHRSPISPRYECQENQFPEYTASRNSICARCDSRSSSRDESNIHPAFRDKPYFGPSSPHHKTSAESLGQRGTETKSASSTNSRKCSTMNSLCSECRNVLKAIRPNVSDRYLGCRPNIHPVIVECLLTGTSDDAIAIVRNLHKRIIRYTTRHFYLHAAVRRSAIPGRKSGHWYDITTEGLHHCRACSTSRLYDNKGSGTIQMVFYSPYSWAKKQKKKKQKHIKKTHVKLREIQILMDFPGQIERAGMIEKKIFESLPKSVKLIKLEHIRAHHALHRLEWWARTHPIHHHTTETSWERGE